MSGAPAPNDRLLTENALSWIHASEIQLLLADYLVEHGGAATVPEMMVDPELSLYLRGVFMKDIAAESGEQPFVRSLAKGDHLFGQRDEEYFLRPDLGLPPCELIDIMKRLALGRIETGYFEPYSELTVLSMASIARHEGAASLEEIVADLEPLILGMFANQRNFFRGPLCAYQLDSLKAIKCGEDGKYRVSHPECMASTLEMEATQALCELRRALRERLKGPSDLYSLIIECCRACGGSIDRDVGPFLPGLCTATGKRFTLSAHQLMEAAPFYFHRLKKHPSADDALSTILDLDVAKIREGASDQIRKAGGTVPKQLADPGETSKTYNGDAWDTSEKRQRMSAIAKAKLASEEDDDNADGQVSAGGGDGGGENGDEDEEEGDVAAVPTLRHNAQLDTLIRWTLSVHGELRIDKLVSELYTYYAGIRGCPGTRYSARLHIYERLGRLGAQKLNAMWSLPHDPPPTVAEVQEIKDEVDRVKQQKGGCRVCMKKKRSSPSGAGLCGACQQYARWHALQSNGGVDAAKDEEEPDEKKAPKSKKGKSLSATKYTRFHKSQDMCVLVRSLLADKPRTHEQLRTMIEPYLLGMRTPTGELYNPINKSAWGAVLGHHLAFLGAVRDEKTKVWMLDEGNEAPSTEEVSAVKGAALERIRACEVEEADVVPKQKQHKVVAATPVKKDNGDKAAKKSVTPDAPVKPAATTTTLPPLQKQQRTSEPTPPKQIDKSRNRTNAASNDKSDKPAPPKPASVDTIKSTAPNMPINIEVSPQHKPPAAPKPAASDTPSKEKTSVLRATSEGAEPTRKKNLPSPSASAKPKAQAEELMLDEPKRKADEPKDADTPKQKKAKDEKSKSQGERKRTDVSSSSSAVPAANSKNEGDAKRVKASPLPVVHAPPSVAPTEQMEPLLRVMLTEEAEVQKSKDVFKHYHMVRVNPRTKAALKEAAAAAYKVTVRDIDALFVVDEQLQGLIQIEEDFQVQDMEDKTKVAVKRSKFQID